MKGISIGRGDARSVGPRVQPVAELGRDSQSDFGDFFSALYPLLDDFSWLVDKAKFWFPDDLTARGFRRDVIARREDCLYFAAGSLRRCGAMDVLRARRATSHDRPRARCLTRRASRLGTSAR